MMCSIGTLARAYDDSLEEPLSGTRQIEPWTTGPGPLAPN